MSSKSVKNENIIIIIQKRNLIPKLTMLTWSVHDEPLNNVRAFWNFYSSSINVLTQDTFRDMILKFLQLFQLLFTCDGVTECHKYKMIETPPTHRGDIFKFTEKPHEIKEDLFPRAPFLDPPPKNTRKISQMFTYNFWTD